MSAPKFGDASRILSPLAAQKLGWRPAEFWSATPAELMLALSEPGSGGAMNAPSRDLIENMMERDAHG